MDSQTPGTRARRIKKKTGGTRMGGGSWFFGEKQAGKVCRKVERRGGVISERRGGKEKEKKDREREREAGNEEGRGVEGGLRREEMAGPA